MVDSEMSVGYMLNTLRVHNDMKLLNYHVTPGTDDNLGWKVRHDSMLRYGNAAACVVTLNDRGLDSLWWL